MSAPDEPAADLDFIAARATFSAVAAALAPPEATLNVYPNTPGDHYDRTALAALSLPGWRAFRATAARRAVLQGFACPGAVAALTPDAWRALDAKDTVEVPLPDFAPVLSALLADVSPGPLRARLAHLFHPATVEAVAPLPVGAEAIFLNVATVPDDPTGGAMYVHQRTIRLAQGPAGATLRAEPTR